MAEPRAAEPRAAEPSATGGESITVSGGGTTRVESSELAAMIDGLERLRLRSITWRERAANAVPLAPSVTGPEAQACAALGRQLDDVTGLTEDTLRALVAAEEAYGEAERRAASRSEFLQNAAGVLAGSALRFARSAVMATSANPGLAAVLGVATGLWIAAGGSTGSARGRTAGGSTLGAPTLGAPTLGAPTLGGPSVGRAPVASPSSAGRADDALGPSDPALGDSPGDAASPGDAPSPRVAPDADPGGPITTADGLSRALLARPDVLAAIESVLGGLDGVVAGLVSPNPVIGMLLTDSAGGAVTEESVTAGVAALAAALGLTAARSGLTGLRVSRAEPAGARRAEPAGAPRSDPARPPGASGGRADGGPDDGGRDDGGASIEAPEPRPSEERPTVPSGFEDLAARVPEPAPGGPQIRIERYGDEWVVYIAGTVDLALDGGAEPWDFASNLELMAGAGGASLEATERSMAAAGIPEGATVSYVGYSQGAIVAMRMAESAPYAASDVVTFGGPVDRIALPEGVRLTAFEHPDDLVVAVDGRHLPEVAEPGRIVVRSEALPRVDVDTEWAAVPAHVLARYEETARAADHSADTRLEARAEALFSRLGAGAISGAPGVGAPGVGSPGTGLPLLADDVSEWRIDRTWEPIDVPTDWRGVFGSATSAAPSAGGGR